MPKSAQLMLRQCWRSHVRATGVECLPMRELFPRGGFFAVLIDAPRDGRSFERYLAARIGAASAPRTQRRVGKPCRWTTPGARLLAPPGSGRGRHQIGWMVMGGGGEHRPREGRLGVGTDGLKEGLGWCG